MLRFVYIYQEVNLSETRFRYTYLDLHTRIKIRKYLLSYAYVHQDLHTSRFLHIYIKIHIYIEIMTGFYEVLSQMVCLVTWLQEICKMVQMIPNLEQFFEAFLRTLHEAIEGLNGHYEPNRASTILDRLHDFEITLGLISSRLASRGFSDQFLEDINELTRALRFLHASYLSRHNDESVAEPRNEPLFQLDCPVEYTGKAGRARYTVECKMGVAGLHDSYLMFLMPFAPSICFERVFYIKFVKEDFSETEY